jgi:hypothetical protein
VRDVVKSLLGLRYDGRVPEIIPRDRVQPFVQFIDERASGRDF